MASLGIRLTILSVFAVLLSASCAGHPVHPQEVDCVQCKKKCPDCQGPFLGGNGIPYGACAGPSDGATCSRTLLDTIDPPPNRVLREGICENLVCRAYSIAGKVCQNGDKVKCRMNDGTIGFTT